MFFAQGLDGWWRGRGAQQCRLVPIFFFSVRYLPTLEGKTGRLSEKYTPINWPTPTLNKLPQGPGGVGKVSGKEAGRASRDSVTTFLRRDMRKRRQ
jgi:hypothetical protein